MKAACFSADATRGRGLGLRYSKPSRAKSLMQPEWEYFRPNSAATWALISTVERQKRPSSHVHNAASWACVYETDRPSSRRRQAHPSHLVGSSYTTHGSCRRPDTGKPKSLGRICRRRAAGSHLPDGQCRGLRADGARKPQARCGLLRKESWDGS